MAPRIYLNSNRPVNPPLCWALLTALSLGYIPKRSLLSHVSPLISKGGALAN